jgi:glycerophosphoryl diester phosphodiesterase
LPTWRTVGDGRALGRALAGPIPDDAVTVRHHLLNPTVVAALHATGAAVMTWTVNDLARARTLIGFGVDGITSDNPAVLALVGATTQPPRR